MIAAGNWLFRLLRLLLKPVPHRIKQRIGLDLNFRRILEKNFPPGSTFRFVQVGGMDGVQFDGLYGFVQSRQASGLIFEPLPDLYEALKANYAHLPGVGLVNAAVHPSLREVTLYRVAPASLDRYPEWAAGIGSLLPEHHRRLNIDSGAIEEVTCPAMTLMEGLHQHNFSGPVHLLQIDVEGFDDEVLKMIDFWTLRPHIIKFEYVNLSPAAIRSSMRLLRQQGYFCFYDFPDAVGVLPATIRL
jgi:FkbM family methyltransferase